MKTKLFRRVVTETTYCRSATRSFEGKILIGMNTIKRERTNFVTDLHSSNHTRAAPSSSITYVNLLNFRSPIAYRRRIIILLSIIRACERFETRVGRKKAKQINYILYIHHIRLSKHGKALSREQGNFGKSPEVPRERVTERSFVILCI